MNKKFINDLTNEQEKQLTKTNIWYRIINSSFIQSNQST